MALGRGFTVMLAGMALAIGTSAVHAEPWVTPFRGHVSFGYAKLFATDAPGGSLAFAAGIDHPLSNTLRAGLDFDFALLGTR